MRQPEPATGDCHTRHEQGAKEKQLLQHFSDIKLSSRVAQIGAFSNSESELLLLKSQFLMKSKNPADKLWINPRWSMRHGNSRDNITLDEGQRFLKLADTALGLKKPPAKEKGNAHRKRG